MPLFSTKTTPLDNLDMNELNIFLNTIRPSIKKKLSLDRIRAAITLIKGLEEAENGMRASMNEKNENLILAATLEDKKKLTEEREQIRSKMKAKQVEIERRKNIIKDEKKKFYKDNKQIIDEHLKKGKIEVSTKVNAINEKRETRRAISEAKKAAEQERLRRLGVTASASASARALAAITKKQQATIRRSSKKLTKSQKGTQFSAFRKAAESQMTNKAVAEKEKPVVPPKSHMVLKSTTGPGKTTVLGKSKKKKRGKNKRKGSKKARR